MEITREGFIEMIGQYGFKSLDEVNKKIRLFKAAKSQRKWSEKNSDKKKKLNAKWYAKYGKEYHRKYKVKLK